MIDLSVEELRMLADIEHQMDVGKIAYVMYHSRRLSVQAPVMEDLKLKNGQSINDQLYCAINEAHIIECEKEMLKHATPKDFDMVG